jgi:hypothetical protein
MWSGMLKDKWEKFKPDSRVAFEGLRMIAIEDDVPDWLRLLANFGAALCVLDGYPSTAEGLRKEQQALGRGRFSFQSQRLLSA